jgi:sterol desaturase/sphingolipid hydroxylase (fatty acid hydroxylase superfamily)
MSPTIQGLLIGFVLLFAVFRLLELLRPRHRRLPVLRKGLVTDICYWAFTPLVTRATTGASVTIAVIVVALVLYGRLDREEILGGYGPLAQLPLWLQAVLMLIAGDFIGYWMHRWFHGARMWPFHAIHHSSVELDWLSSVRLHPVNDALMRIAGAVPLLLAGFAPMALATVAPVLTLFAILVHANLDWDWGPFRSVIASPRFHRWHHTDETEARDKNFAGLLPLWDILFGTYYMPAGKLPSRFGTTTPVPAGLLGQLWFPFSRRSRAEAITPPSPPSRSRASP